MRLIDIDNCVADDGWRIEVIGKTPSAQTPRNPNERYHLYHACSIWDEHRNEDLLRTSESIAFLTARPVMFRGITDEWLRRNTGLQEKGYYLLMRNNNDFRGSLPTKRDQVKWLIAHYGVTLANISAAFDDRPEIVEMYRAEFGITAEVRSIHSIPYPRFEDEHKHD